MSLFLINVMSKRDSFDFKILFRISQMRSHPPDETTTTTFQSIFRPDHYDDYHVDDVDDVDDVVDDGCTIPTHSESK